MSEWQDIASAPKDGSYVLLSFDGPFYDLESPCVAVGKWSASGWWLTCIWAGSTAHVEPARWQPFTPPVQS